MEIFSNPLSLHLQTKQPTHIFSDSSESGTININLLSRSNLGANIHLFAINENGQVVGMMKQLEDKGLHYGVFHSGDTCITVFSDWGSKNSQTLVPKSDVTKLSSLQIMTDVSFQFWYETNALLMQVYPEQKVALSVLNKPLGLSQAKFAIQFFSHLFQSKQKSKVSIVSQWTDIYNSFANQDHMLDCDYILKAIGTPKDLPVDHVKIAPFEKLDFFLISDQDCSIEYRIFPVQFANPFGSIKIQNLEPKINKTCANFEGSHSFQRIQIEKLNRLEISSLDLKSFRQIHLECFHQNPHIQSTLLKLPIQTGFEWTNPFYLESTIKNESDLSRLENEWRMFDEIEKAIFARTEDGSPCLLYLCEKDKKLFENNKRIFSVGLLMTIPPHLKFMHLCLGDPVVFCYKPNDGILWIPFDQIDFLSEISPSDL